MNTDETREALNDFIQFGGYRHNLTALESTLAAHERAIRAEAVAEVVEFLDSQTGPDEVVGWSRHAARCVQRWFDARADRIESEARG